MIEDPSSVSVVLDALDFEEFTEFAEFADLTDFEDLEDSAVDGEYFTEMTGFWFSET